MSVDDGVRLLAREHRLQVVDLDRHPVDPTVAELLPERLAQAYAAVPVGRRYGAPVVAVADPGDLVAMDSLRASLGRDFLPVVASREQIERFIDRLYHGAPGPLAAPGDPDQGPPTDPVTAALVEALQQPARRLPPVPPGLAEPSPTPLPAEPPASAPPPAMPPPPLARAPEGVPPPAGIVGGTGLEDDLASFPPLARALVESGRVPLAAMRDALYEQTRSGESLARCLARLGLVSEADLLWGVAHELGLEFVDLDVFGVDLTQALRLPETTARHHGVLVVQDRDGVPVVATSNPTNVLAADDLRTVLGKRFVMVVATRTQIATYLDRAYSQGISAAEAASSAADQMGVPVSEDLETLQVVAEDAPVVRYVNLLVLQALNERASDIHVEPTAGQLRIRYRIDGVLHDMAPAPKSIAPAVTTRLKVMAELDIAEHRLPQDGRISLNVGNRTVDLRIATLPTIHGEKIVMRVLDKSNVVLSFDELGFDEDLLARYREIYTKPYGTVLVTGPTGSGKTTTLYATLSVLNSPEKNIITVEDPVELRIPGINQVQLNVKAGLTFAAALRSILRADPDIVLVGEVRDKETAMISVEAALTGHLVLATLHTNDAASTPMRLVEMGVEPYLVGSAASAIVAQRLARRLCRHCREPFEPTEAEVAALGWDPAQVFASSSVPTLYRAKGCGACAHTGYRGRRALAELLVVTEEVEQMIVAGAPAEQIHRLAVEQGMVPLREHGLRRALEGETTLEEVLRVVA
ncbi:ATPase, T2SS/T4P/T4SS family [Aciditerrimonas ferrireducens]|uniref:ATPase, T2SS/T4P/T4SS family n=1 Tax=Aciditerrimonas ferrireducens TaxID=667306 RepID=UPI00249F91E8|nr:ATPase, T2SS/T4P/T4SS family [Aciditerrimonas ferrireducens]